MSVHTAVYTNKPGDRPGCLSSHYELQRQTTRPAELSLFTLRTTQADHKTDRPYWHCSHYEPHRQTTRPSELSQFTLRTTQVDHKTGRTVTVHTTNYTGRPQDWPSCDCSHYDLHRQTTRPAKLTLFTLRTTQVDHKTGRADTVHATNHTGRPQNWPNCHSSHYKPHRQTTRPTVLSTQVDHKTGRTVTVHTTNHTGRPQDRPSWHCSHYEPHRQTARPTELSQFTPRTTQADRKTGRADTVHTTNYTGRLQDRPNCHSSRYELHRQTTRLAELSQFTLRTTQADHKTGRAVAVHTANYTGRPQDRPNCHCWHYDLHR